MGELITAVVGVVGEIWAGRVDRSAARKEREARDLERKKQDSIALREKRQSIKQQNVLRGQIIGGAAASEASGDSSVAGGAAAVQSQTASNLGFINQLQENVNKQGRLYERALQYRTRASTIRALHGTGGAVAGASVDYARTFSSGSKTA